MKRNELIDAIVKLHSHKLEAKGTTDRFRASLDRMSDTDLAWYADFASDGMLKMQAAQ